MASKSGFDLDVMKVEDLTALIHAAEAKRAEKQEEAKAGFLAEMQAKAEAIGLSLSDLLPPMSARAPGRKPRSDAGKPAVAKFRGPGGQTWTGRGRPPTWLTELEAQGKKRDEFRI